MLKFKKKAMTLAAMVLAASLSSTAFAEKHYPKKKHPPIPGLEVKKDHPHSKQWLKSHHPKPAKKLPPPNFVNPGE